MNKCCNTDHPHCTLWVMPGERVCEGGHQQPAAPALPASYDLLKGARGAAGMQPSVARSVQESPAANYAGAMRAPRPQLHISGFDPRAAGGRQTLKMELRGMPQDCAPQLAIQLNSELIPNGSSRQQFVRSVDGGWRPVFAEFSSRGKEHGQYQINMEVVSRAPGQPERKWECTFVILVPRLDASLTEIHRIFLSTHKNVRVMADDASIARVSAQGGESMDIDVTARNAGIAHLDLGAPQGKVDLGFSTIAWDEDLIEIDMPPAGPAHPFPSRAASIVNAAPEAGMQRHIRLFALDECIFGRFELVDPEAHALLTHYSANGQETGGLTRRLSGRHAIIRRGAHGFEIEDVSRYGLLLDGVWPGKHKPVPLRLGMRIEMSASIKGIAVLTVSAIMPHGVVLHRIDEGATAECFVVLAPDTHPGYPVARFQAAPNAAALPLLMHHNGGFWHLDQLTGKETALAPTVQLDKLSRMQKLTRFASDAYPEHWIIRTSGVDHATVSAHELHTA
ncbi:FHA domain-containing protein [Massilia endophytica]|uniref:FHA domain-containing protein n=1 Tax=Massilia endophytica TaxID=2899220 RepID=UPI001E3953F7|nr:FHA domain-containing protein [Massilia endophytica]UGQ48315.1 FHA domain-containing protein [Massilia endophytica]